MCGTAEGGRTPYLTPRACTTHQAVHEEVLTSSGGSNGTYALFDAASLEPAFLSSLKSEFFLFTFCEALDGGSCCIFLSWYSGPSVQHTTHSKICQRSPPYKVMQKTAQWYDFVISMIGQTSKILR